MPTSHYQEVANDLYRRAALNPNLGLCCTTTPVWQVKDLHVPQRMLDMNYGCGSTVNARDLVKDPRILYVGVGGGMELLRFAYYSRQTSGVIGIDLLDEMLDASRVNLLEATRTNPWFQPEFVDLRKGDALNLPVEDQSVDVAAQNCLFNIFKAADLRKAIAEMYRALRPRGRLVLSDPICDAGMPDSLVNDDELRAQCLSGALPLAEYIRMLTDAGFGTIEIRARRPYRVLSPKHYNTDRLVYIESVEVCAIKDPMPADGPCVFTGRTAIYYGDSDFLDDHKGHVIFRNQPLAVCDKTAENLRRNFPDDLLITGSTYFYDGGGCC